MPRLKVAFLLFLLARLLAAAFSNISDCDETFNYWEPTHFLAFNSGFQTWEYSPLYAIRSYAYLWLYAWPSVLMSTLNINKVYIFYATRALIAMFAALCDITFLR